MAVYHLPMELVFLLSWLGLIGYVPEDGPPKTPASEVRRIDAEQYLPDSTLAYVSIVDPATISRHMSETQLWGMVQKSSFQPDLRSTIEEARGEFKDNFHLPYADLTQIFTGPMAIALLDLDPNSFEEQPPRVAFFADLADGSADRLWTLLAANIFPEATKQGLTVEAVSDGPVPYTRIKQGETKLVLAAFAVQKNRFLFVTNEQDVSLLAKPAAQPLSQNLDFQTYKDEMAKADIVAYASLGALTGKALAKVEKNSSDGWLLGLGLERLRGIVYTATAVQGGFVEKTTLAHKPISSGSLIRMLDRSRGAAVQAIDLIPATSDMAWDLHLGPMDMLYDLMNSKSNPDDEKQLSDGLGVDFRKDILEQMTGEFALSIRWPDFTPSLMSETVALGMLGSLQTSFYVGVRDEAKAEATLRKMLQKGEFTYSDDTYKGIKASYLTTSNQPIPVIPAYCITNGVLGFHLNAGAVKASIDAKVDGKSLRSDADFKAASQGLDRDPSAGIFYARLSSLGQFLARLGLFEMSRGGPSDEQAKAEKFFHELEALSKDFRGAYARYQFEDGSTVIEAASPLGIGAGMPLLSLFGAILEEKSRTTAEEPITATPEEAQPESVSPDQPATEPATEPSEATEPATEPAATPAEATEPATEPAATPAEATEPATEPAATPSEATEPASAPAETPVPASSSPAEPAAPAAPGSTESSATEAAPAPAATP